MEKEKELKVSPAKRKAAERYLSQFVDLRVRLKPEEKQAVVEYAAQRGESVNKMLLRLIREEMERDNGGERASAPAANTESPKEARDIPPVKVKVVSQEEYDKTPVDLKKQAENDRAAAADFARLQENLEITNLKMKRR